MIRALGPSDIASAGFGAMCSGDDVIRPDDSDVPTSLLTPDHDGRDYRCKRLRG
jgi:hypothetical protein